MESKPVFYDPQGRRGTFVTRLGALVATILAVVTTLTLVVALFATIYLPSEAAKPHINRLPGSPNPNFARPSKLTPDLQRSLNQEIEAERKRVHQTPVVTNSTVVAGFYAPWQESSGLASLNAHASSLTHVIPQWIHLTGDGEGIDLTTDFDLVTHPDNRAVIKLARENGLAVMPILDNGYNGDFDPDRLKKLLDSPKAMEGVAAFMADFLTDRKDANFKGINIDFERVPPGYGEKYLDFLKVLRKHFEPKGLQISADIEAENVLPLAQVAQVCDFVILMDYDEHAEDDPPGPVASLDWSQKLVDQMLQQIPNDKLVLGLGNYANDWTDGKTEAEGETFQEALTNAQGYREEPPAQVIDFDDSFNNKFEYEDENDKHHIVYMLDAVSAYDQWKSARGYDLRGAALWYLGSEDPSIWSFFDRRSLMGPMDAKLLEQVSFPYEITFTGRGEVLTIKNRPETGERKLGLDDSGIIDDCTYTKYASPYVVQKSGYISKELALTFDDGPDPEWTPQILDVLKEFHAPATFFVIGNSVEQHMSLVGREYAEGHEVGSHSFFHPDMGTISLERDRLELNLTQFAIEAATGRSTRLFRPPYNADSEPSTAEQLQPIDVAAKLGYITVAENVDPQDWNLQMVDNKTGQIRGKTPDDIYQSIHETLAKETVNHNEGNVILLHDAGGNRSATVAALKELIPKLRADGYEFVSVASLLKTNRDYLMPPIYAQDMQIYLLTKYVLGAAYGFLWFLSAAFTTAIALGLMRILAVTTLAFINRGRERHAPFDPAFEPPVSVLIAAYNEEPVIRRTVESVLAMDYPLAEIIVVDDGSMDLTAKVVEDAFENDPRVRLIRQENGGKSSALNHALGLASGEFLFCIDADTQLDPMAVRRMVQHFRNPKVGAVAGNVRVGNEVNVITYWQSLEYTTSQNLDRRAYAYLNAITVVPGAIGAWRREAVLSVGGYLNDTLAEDMDLTWRLRRAGYVLENEPQAYAYTEAPQGFSGFFRQRFRWAYGTLQCLYKHRGALCHYGWFGWVALPALWVFQVFFQAIAPLVDLEVIISIVKYLFALSSASTENGSQALGGETQTIITVGFLYALFFGVELVCAALATRMEHQRFRLLWWLFLQRFAYRQIMYGVIYRSLVRAVTGGRTGWGKIDRKGTVKVPVR